MIENPITPTLNNQEPTSFFSSLVNFFVIAGFIFAAIYFFFNLVLGGISWIGSGGDKAKLQEARSRVINAVIGLVVVLSTYMIVNFLGTVFGINLLSFDLSSLQL